ncbi:MAG: cupin domain-containing protein [Burkholderiales bacterium]|nr:cupin domain-containing protein [Burkholderiales bacterium]
MKKHLIAAGLALAVVVPVTAVFAQRAIDDKGFVTLKLGDEQWTDYPGIPGIRIMVVEGDPKKPGPYVIRVKFEPGTMSMPHFHPEDRLVTVLKGTWWTGKGEIFDPESTEPLPAGGYMKHPSKEAHYDGAKDEEVILQIAGMGPSGTTFFKPDLGATGRSR